MFWLLGLCVLVALSLAAAPDGGEGADGTDGGGGGGAGDGAAGVGEGDGGAADEKKFTQTDLDRAIKERLQREQRAHAASLEAAGRAKTTAEEERDEALAVVEEARRQLSNTSPSAGGSAAGEGSGGRPSSESAANRRELALARAEITRLNTLQIAGRDLSPAYAAMVTGATEVEVLASIDVARDAQAAAQADTVADVFTDLQTLSAEQLEAKYGDQAKAVVGRLRTGVQPVGAGGNVRRGAPGGVTVTTDGIAEATSLEELQAALAKKGVRLTTPPGISRKTPP
jgi:hypothetical protein